MKQSATVIMAGALILIMTGSVYSQEPDQNKPGMRVEQGQAMPGGQNIDAKTYIELMKTNVKGQKKQIHIQSMELNPEQAKIFWPIYDDYDHDLDKLNDKMIEIIMDYSKNYQHMTDKVAHDLMTRSLDNQEQKLKLKKAYAKKMEKVLSAKIAARFFQVDGVINKMIELQIDSNLPLIKSD